MEVRLTLRQVKDRLLLEQHNAEHEAAICRATGTGHAFGFAGLRCVNCEQRFDYVPMTLAGEALRHIERLERRRSASSIPEPHSSTGGAA